MEKLIIAGDSRTSYPHNHLCLTQEDIPGVTQQYVDAMNADAAIAHIHGRRTLEEAFQADGKMVSKIHHADWKRLHESIMSKVDPIMQYGVASARIEEKIELMKLGPDMMAVAFNAHDGYEDNPYIRPGEFAKSNAVLVEKIVGIAQSLNREVATPDEARKILGLQRSL
jgi:3-keto-5-aminohexanoate cleavage enzyme